MKKKFKRFGENEKTAKIKWRRIMSVFLAAAMFVSGGAFGDFAKIGLAAVAEDVYNEDSPSEFDEESGNTDEESDNTVEVYSAADELPWMMITGGVYRAYSKNNPRAQYGDNVYADVDLSNPSNPKMKLEDNSYDNPLIIYNGTTLTVEGYTTFYTDNGDGTYTTSAQIYGENVIWDEWAKGSNAKNPRFSKVDGSDHQELVEVNGINMLRFTSQFKANDIKADDIGIYCVTFDTGKDNNNDNDKYQQLFLYQRPTLISINSKYDLKDMNRVNERLAGAADFGDVDNGKYNSNHKKRGYQVHIGDPLQIQGAAIGDHYGTFDLESNKYIAIARQENGLVEFKFLEDSYNETYGLTVELKYKTGVTDEYGNEVVESCYLTVTDGGPSTDRKYDHADIEIADGGKYTVENKVKIGDKLVKKEELIYDAYIEDVNFSEIYNSYDQVIEKYVKSQYWKNPKYKIGDAQYELTSKWLVNSERKVGIQYPAGDDYVFYMRSKDNLIIDKNATSTTTPSLEGYNIIDYDRKIQNIQGQTEDGKYYVIASVGDPDADTPQWNPNDNYGTRKIYTGDGTILETKGKYDEIIGDGIVVQDHVDHALFDVQLVLKPATEVVTYYNTKANGEVISRVETTYYTKGYPDKKVIEYYNEEGNAIAKTETIDLPDPEPNAETKMITIPSVKIEMDAQDVIDAHNKCPDHTGLDFTVTSDIKKLITRKLVASVSPEATKFYDGKSELGDKSFEFELIDKDGVVVSSVRNDADGKIEFDSLEFFSKGDYEYTMREVKGNDVITIYDKTEYKVKISVDEDDNGLIASVSYYKVGNNVETPAVFNNYSHYYNLPSTGGPGVYIFIISGAGFILAAAVMLYRKKRKEE